MEQQHPLFDFRDIPLNTEKIEEWRLYRHTPEGIKYSPMTVSSWYIRKYPSFVDALREKGFFLEPNTPLLDELSQTSIDQSD